ncbi:MAG TPA: reverse transcriptase family protein [Ktedonobacterales bacterium]
MRERLRRLFRRSSAPALPEAPSTPPAPTPPPPSLPPASAPPGVSAPPAVFAAPAPAAPVAPPDSLPGTATLPAPATAPTHTWPEPRVLTARQQQRRMRDRAYFGEEVWGASARQRGATADAARLARYGLPVLRTEEELAAWLGIPLGRLRWYTHDRAAETTWHYVRYAVPKRGGGGERVILAPRRALKALQRKVLTGIAARVPVAGSTHGFVVGRSILTNARVHAGKRVVLRLDLKDFFPSVTYPRVRGLFIALGYPFAVAAALALLCTEYDRRPFERDGTRYYISVGPRHLVQGAPTSPALANLVAWRLDRRLGGLAANRGFTYTRYADDLTFSGEDAEAANRLRATAQRIIAAEQFTVNTAKTRIARRSARQLVTGLVVNEAPATPRALRRRLRAILHNAARTGLEAQNRDGHAHYAAHLQGLIAYVGAANPQHAATLRAALQRATGPSTD